MSGSREAASAASSAFSTNSRIVVYSALPGPSNPAMFWCSAKNSAGFCAAQGARARGVWLAVGASA
jgi:hypothetical protein